MSKQLKEIYYLKTDNGHFKFIEKSGKKIKEIRFTHKVEVLNIHKIALDSYLSKCNLVTRKEIESYILERDLYFRLPEDAKIEVKQGNLFENETGK